MNQELNPSTASPAPSREVWTLDPARGMVSRSEYPNGMFANFYRVEDVDAPAPSTGKDSGEEAELAEALEWFEEENLLDVAIPLGRAANPLVRVRAKGKVLARAVRALRAEVEGLKYAYDKVYRALTDAVAAEPRVWDAETIKDAPEGRYILVNDDEGEYHFTMGVFAARSSLKKDQYPVAIGPIPRPPSVNPKEEEK